jgi:protein-S-isoprenylcysteine O-methyltransferase Ste14
MEPKVWLRLGAQFLIFATLLFGGAGTLAWPAAWAFLFLFLGPTALITSWLSRSNQALLRERMKLPVQKGQPFWDKILVGSLIIVFACWLVLMGVDAGRLHWSSVPWPLQFLGAAGMLLSMWISFRVFEANPFLANAVRIQTERGHRVVTGGPYRFIRHPLYAATLLLFPSCALVLGSWLGLAGTIVLAGLIVLRTALEDRELLEKLAGYRTYAQQVRYRLIPRVW